MRAPSPVGELGNVEMTQALSIIEPHWQGIGQDMLLTGYLPASGGPEALDAALSGHHLQLAAQQSNGTSPSSSAPDLSPRGKDRRRSQSDSNKVGIACLYSHQQQPERTPSQDCLCARFVRKQALPVLTKLLLLSCRACYSQTWQSCDAAKSP